jgi:hypothetical protein
MTKHNTPDDKGNNGLFPLKGMALSNNGMAQTASGNLTGAYLKRIIEDALAILDEDFCDTMGTTSSNLSADFKSHRPRYQ